MEVSVNADEIERGGKNMQAVAPIVRDESMKSMNRAVLKIEGTSKKLVPVDTGHLRRSLTHEVTQSAGAVVGKVGTNVPYAKAVEFGTGLLSVAPDSGHARHFPPPAALDAWAIRHGFHVGSAASASSDVAASPGSLGFIVSQIIWNRGGIKPKPYLKPAVDQNLAVINREFGLIPQRVSKRLAAMP